MNFVKYINVLPVGRAHLLSFASLFLLLLMFVNCVPLLLVRPVIHIDYPKAVTSDLLNSRDTVVVVTGENILYVDNKVTTLSELKDFMTNGPIKGLFIKVDRRASVGRVIDVWNMARATGVKRVSLASDQEE